MKMLRRLVLALVFALVGTAAFAAESYVTSAAVREKGFAALTARIGETRPLARLTFTPDEISAVAQPDYGDGFVKWTVSRVDLRLVNFHFVNGPTQAYEIGVVDDQVGAFFRQDEIDITAFDRMLDAAIAHARLVETPTIVSVEIARSVAILPSPGYGDIRWTVALRTADESASVYLNRRGDVIGADLSDTKRARDLDMLAGDEWPMAEAQAALGSVLAGARVHDVQIGRDSIALTADHPTDSGLQRDYTWRLGGVTRGFMDTPNLVTIGMGRIVSFPFTELDFTRLPQIKVAARDAFGAPDAIITAIEASKPTDRPAGELKVLWEVEFREPNGEQGAVWLDATGTVIEVKLPESRLPEAGPWLAPATVMDTLRRIGDTFGQDAKISEITIDDSLASLDIEDPQAPGKIAQFLVKPHEIVRFGSASFFASIEPGAYFTPADLAGLDVAQLEDMVRRTTDRLELPGGAVFRYTISRHALIMDPGDDRLMIEIRYGEDNGSGDAGWMTFLLDGTQTDELLP